MSIRKVTKYQLANGSFYDTYEEALKVSNIQELTAWLYSMAGGNFDPDGTYRVVDVVSALVDCPEFSVKQAPESEVRC